MQTAATTTSPNPPARPDIDPRDPKGLGAVREYLAGLLAQGRNDEVLDQTTHLLHTLASANSDLTHQLEALRKALYGRRSEKLDPAQLTLFARLFGEEAAPEPEKPEPTDPAKPVRAPQRRCRRRLACRGCCRCNSRPCRRCTRPLGRCRRRYSCCHRRRPRRSAARKRIC